MLLLIISEYYCPTTFLPLSDTLPGCSCSICSCSEGWLNTCEAMPVCICSSPNNRRLSLCSSWNLNNPLPTHEPTICSGLFGAVTVPVWEQLHRVHPHKHVESCFLSSLEGGTVGRTWTYPLSGFLRVLKKYLFCSDRNTEIMWFQSALLLPLYSRFQTHP